MEPVNKWEPVTDFYKEQQAVQTADPVVETQQRLDEIREQAKKDTADKKAPLGIRIYGWYLICRVGLFFLLLLVVASFPQLETTKWLVTSLERSLPMHAERQQQEREREFFRERGFDPDAVYHADGSPNEDSPEARYNRLREFVMVCLFILAGLTTVVAFMWWNRSWKVRWVAMFYAGAFLARAALGLFAGWASNAVGQLSPVQITSLIFAMAVNGFVFCYLAFWPGVEEWFREW